MSYQNRYKVALKKKVDYMRLAFEKCIEARCYKNPLENINEKYISVDMLVKSLSDNISKKIIVTKKDFEGIVTKLDALSPLKTLTRGYSIAKKEDKIIKSAKVLKSGDKISIQFSDGERKAEIV